MRKTSGLLAILVLMAALAAPVAAQQNLYKQDVVSADSGLFRYLFSSHTVSAEGGIGVPCINMSASANTKYSLVGYDSTPITVVTRVRKDNVDVSAVTVADSLHSVVLDTLPLNGASTTQYDVNKIASFKLRVRFTAADATNDTWAIYVYGKDQSGIGTKTTLKKKTAATLDTVTDNYFSYIDSIRVTTKATGDSVAVWAYPNGIGVVTGTGYTSTLGPEGAVGIAQTAMAGRTRGLVVFNGPSPVLVNGTTSTVVPGYWLVPAGVAGKCSTAQTKPNVAVGRVTGYLTVDGTVGAFIFPMLQNPATAVADSATRAHLATLADSAINLRGKAATSALADSAIALRATSLARTDKVTSWGDSVVDITGIKAAFTVMTKSIRIQDTLVSGVASAANCGHTYLFTLPATDSIEVLWCKVLVESIGTTGGTNTAVNAFSVGDSNASTNPTLNGNEILWVASTNQNASLSLGYTTVAQQGTNLYTGGAVTGGSIVNTATKVYLNRGGTPNADGRLGLKVRVMFGCRSLKRGTW